MLIHRVLLSCGLCVFMAPAVAATILVSAASSLGPVFGELAARYEAAHPGREVQLNTGASDVVLQQIIQGAPADVFASADQAAMARGIEARVIEPATQQTFARNTVVLIVPADNPADIHSVEDLRDDRVRRVALGNPRWVPVGRYTQAALEQSGHWPAVRARGIMAQNARQVLRYVARGEADAGFVFATDAAGAPDDVQVIQPVLTPAPVVYPIALVRREGRAPEAQAFLDYVLSAAGQAVLAKHGFAQP